MRSALFSVLPDVPDRRSVLVLVPPIGARLKAVLAEVAAADDLTMHAHEVMPDHVHAFVEAGPTMHPAEIVKNTIKRRAVGRRRLIVKGLGAKPPSSE